MHLKAFEEGQEKCPVVTFISVASLAAAYLPLLSGGCLLLLTRQVFCLGEQVHFMAELPEGEPIRPVCGRVVWISPGRSAAGHAPGVGVCLDQDDAGRLLNKKIQGLVAGLPVASLATGF